MTRCQYDFGDCLIFAQNMIFIDTINNMIGYSMKTEEANISTIDQKVQHHRL